MRIWLVLLAGCGALGRTPDSPTRGDIAGLARDHDSGDPIAKAELRIRAQGEIQPILVISAQDGRYHVPHLAPGRYSVDALFANQQVDVENIDVKPGETTYVDVVFTLGHPDPVHVDFNDAKQSEIDHFRPSHHPLALIEGTVNDVSTRLRVTGAVITAVRDDQPDALQTVTDDAGRFRFDPVQPGTYAVSAYYSIGGHAQVEVRRSEIHVDPAEGVIVPLFVETAGRY